MELIKITKIFRGGMNIHNLLVDDGLSDEEILEKVEDWCERDLGGAESGYSYSYVKNTDEKELIEAVTNRCSNILSHMNKLGVELEKLKDFLKTI